MPPGRRSLGWIARSGVGTSVGLTAGARSSSVTTMSSPSNSAVRSIVPGWPWYPWMMMFVTASSTAWTRSVDARCRRLARAGHLADGGADVREPLDIGVDVQLAADGDQLVQSAAADQAWSSMMLPSGSVRSTR